MAGLALQVPSLGGDGQWHLVSPVILPVEHSLGDGPRDFIVVIVSISTVAASPNTLVTQLLSLGLIRSTEALEQKKDHHHPSTVNAPPPLSVFAAVMNTTRITWLAVRHWRATAPDTTPVTNRTLVRFPLNCETTRHCQGTRLGEGIYQYGH